MVNVTQDVSTLTTIPDKSLNKLLSKFIYVINDAVAEARINKQSVVDLNIGLGILSLEIGQDELKYKFVPSKNLEETLKATVLEERNLLEDALETSLVEKLTTAYKDLL